MRWFSKRSEFEANVSTAFSHIKEDTNVMYKWISWLKTNHDMLHEKHKDHRRLNDERHANLKREIALLKKENETLTDSMLRLYEYIKKIHTEFKEIGGKLDELSKPKPEEPIESIEEFQPKLEFQPINSGGILTSAETELVSLLANGNPLSYGELSNALNLSYGTVKNRLNRVKTKGIRIEFAVDKKGERKFFLPETEQIRLSGR